VYEAMTDVDGHRRRVAGRQSSPRLALPVGRYYVTAEYGSALAATEVDIKAGEIKSETLNLRAGILNLSSVLATASPPLAADVRYEVYEAAQDVAGHRKRVSSSPGHEGASRFAVPAGRYFVTAASGNALASAEIDISAGEIRFETLNLRAGILNVSSALTAAGPALATGVHYDIFEAAQRVDGSRRRFSSSPAHE